LLLQSLPPENTAVLLVLAAAGYVAASWLADATTPTEQQPRSDPHRDLADFAAH
jgi:hypothetical protein